MKKQRLTSKEVMKTLKISSCDIMHLREEGKLRAVKRGNAYLYSEGDVKKVLSKKKSN